MKHEQNDFCYVCKFVLLWQNFFFTLNSQLESFFYGGLNANFINKLNLTLIQNNVFYVYFHSDIIPTEWVLVMFKQFWSRDKTVSKRATLFPPNCYRLFTLFTSGLLLLRSKRIWRKESRSLASCLELSFWENFSQVSVNFIKVRKTCKTHSD